VTKRGKDYFDLAAKLNSAEWPATTSTRILLARLKAGATRSIPGPAASFGVGTLDSFAFAAGLRTVELIRTTYLPGGNPCAAGMENSPFFTVAPPPTLPFDSGLKDTVP